MVTNKCAICSVSCGDKEHAGQCIVCKSIYYCSPVCQKIDWPLHKILCQKYADFEKNNPRPADIVEDRKTTFHKLAILFSGDSTAIELIWLGAELHSEIDDKTDELLEFSSSTSWPFYEYLGAAKGIEFVKNERIIEVMVGGGTLGRTPNVAIENLCKGYSTAHSYSHNKSYRLGSGFSGNLTITHKKTESRPEAKNPSVDVHQDVTLEDFRYGFNWITQQYNVFDCNSANKFLVRGADSWTKGVMIKCPKDVELSASVAKYQEVLLKYRDSIDGLKHGATSVHRLFRTSDTCSISEQMGMELSYDELGCSTFRQANLGTCRGYQRIASILINADPQSEFWGSEFPKSLSNRLKYMDMQDALNTIAAETVN